MTRYVLDAFDFAVTEEALLTRCRTRRDREEGARALELLAEGQRFARPRALVVEAAVAAGAAADRVVVGGVEIRSEFVRAKLLQTSVAYAFVATCGGEAERWSAGFDDFLDRFYADEIKKLWLARAVAAVEDDVKGRFAPAAKLAVLNPGSLPQWPIEGQRELFRILGDTEGTVGVKLTESCLMVPTKSVSGLFFADRTGHVNCALCPRANCPNRRAPVRVKHAGQ